MKKKDNQIKVLENKAKLAWKQYKIVILGISIAKIDLEKGDKIRENIVIQNACIYARIKI